MNAPRRPGPPAQPANLRQVPPAPVPGVIETIADGLTLVLVYPMVLLVPLLVDAVYWSGIRISPAALIGRFTSLGEPFDQVGLNGDVTPIMAIFVPSLLEWVDRDALFHAWSATEIAPGSWESVSLTIVGLLVAGSMLAVLFRVPLALVIRQERRSPLWVIRAVAVAWVRLVALAALVIGLVLLVVSPLAVLSAFFLLAGVNVAPLLVAGLSIPAIAAAIYLHFTPDAIVLSEVGPLRAIYLSFNVVRRNFWATIGLLGSFLLISEGLTVLWLSQADTPIGLLIGVLGNAFVGAGLALAAMQFYTDRLRRWLPDPHPSGGPPQSR